MERKPISFSIKHWSQGDRPREKLLQKGRRVLSDAELLAIIIGSGTPNESALALSKRVLNSVDNNLNALGKLSLQQLMTFKGIGQAKAVAIVSALEIGRRHRVEKALEKKKINSSNLVFELMQPLLGDLEHEEFWVLYLSHSKKVILQFQLSKGGITGTVVDVRLVFKKAIELGATAVILVHNHPSGTLKPSNSDKTLTQKLKQAAASLDISLLDHLIITEKAYFSFADSNLI